MKFDVNYFIEILPKVISKLDVTLRITLMATLMALAIGILLSVVSYYRIKGLYQFARIYKSVIRGTPLTPQLYFFYYGLAIYSTAIRDMTPMMAVAVVIGLNQGAFMSESMRAALMSVDEGQKEAAASLGMTKMQMMHRIILPQAVRIALPPLFNDIINLIKATSLAFMLGVPDIMGAAKIEGAKTFRYFEIYAAAMLVYWIIITLLGIAHQYMEKRCQDAY